MNLSGILVTTDRAHTAEVIATLAALPGVAVDGCDPDRGRIVVIQEAADVHDEIAGFGRIRALPHVLGADLVCHCLDAGD